MSGDENQVASELRTLEFRRLTDKCRRGAFSCGNSEIDRWFKRDSLKQHVSMRFRVSTAYYTNTDNLVGFYALTTKLENESLLDKQTRLITFSQYGYFTTVRLAWVAVQRHLQRKGFGRAIMGSAIQDFYEIAVRTGIYAMTLTAIDTKTAEFYGKLGFVYYGDRDATQPSMLLPSRSVIEMIERKKMLANA